MHIFNRTDAKPRRKLLRGNMTAPEKILWERLRCRQVKGCKFRRQYSIGKYVVDFYCPESRLALEIDGDSHFFDKAIEYHNTRQAFIESTGIRLLRFTNKDVTENVEGVMESIVKKLEESGTSP